MSWITGLFYGTVLSVRALDEFPPVPYLDEAKATEGDLMRQLCLRSDFENPERPYDLERRNDAISNLLTPPKHPRPKVAIRKTARGTKTCHSWHVLVPRVSSTCRPRPSELKSQSERRRQDPHVEPSFGLRLGTWKRLSSATLDLPERTPFR